MTELLTSPLRTKRNPKEAGVKPMRQTVEPGQVQVEEERMAPSQDTVVTEEAVRDPMGIEERAEERDQAAVVVV